MRVLLATVATVLLLEGSVERTHTALAFTSTAFPVHPVHPLQTRSGYHEPSTSSLRAATTPESSTSEEESGSAPTTPSPSSSRRSFFERSLTQASSTAALLGALSVTANPLVFPTRPAQALSGATKVNAKLKGYGLPALQKIPDGFTPLLEIYGKGKNRFPLLVSFSHPLSWVVTTPSNDQNGEDGTVQAGEYAKGDTATFFVYSEPGAVKDLSNQPKELFEKALMRSIGQKGDNMYQNFKVTKLEPVTYEDGKTYVLADFKYQLLTGAGFEVDRKGVASITSQGEAVEVLWAASTAVRYKKTEAQLRDIVASFRCYADGLNFSSELVTFDDLS